MEPPLLFSERERRLDRRARCIIVAVFTVIDYALLWYWGYLGWSPGSMALVIAVPVLLSFFAIVNNPVEGTVVCLIMLILVALALPVFRQTQIRGRETIELSNGRFVVSALLEYAHEHGEMFPRKLEDVAFDGIPSEALHFHDPKTRQESNWLYYGGDNLNPLSPQQTILLASPPMVDLQKRIVIFIDGAARLISEDDFVKLQSKQQVTPAPRPAEPFTPQPGSPLYTQIYDAVRHIPHPLFGIPNSEPPWTSEPYAQLFPGFFMVQGDWAIIDAGFDAKREGAIAATLHRVNGNWTPVNHWWHDDMPIGRNFRGDDKPDNEAKGLPDDLIRAWDKHFQIGESK